MNQRYIDFSQNPVRNASQLDLASIQDNQTINSRIIKNNSIEIVGMSEKNYLTKGRISTMKQSQSETRKSTAARNRTESKPQTVKLMSKALKIKKFALRFIKQSSLGKFRSLTLNQLNIIGDNASFQQGNNMSIRQDSLDTLSGQMLPQRIKKYPIFKHFRKLKSFSSQILSRCQICLQFLPNIPVISPCSSLRFIWEMIMMITIMIFLFIIPIEITFNQQIRQFFSSLFLNSIIGVLILDFFMSWNCGYFEKGLPIMNRRQIAINYFKSNFLIDFIASFLIILDFIQGYEDHNYFHLLFLLKFRNIKLFFKRIEERFNMNPLVMQISSLIQLLLLIIFASHLISCVWIKVESEESQAGIQSWISFKNIDRNDWISTYITAYYFSTVTMITVGYGDFKPVNNLEMIISVITMLTSCGIFAYTINMVGTIFNSINTRHSEIKNNLFYVGDLMNKRQIGLELQIQIKEYLEYQWKNHPIEDLEKESQLINQLTPQLRDNLMFETYKDILLNYTVFKKNFSESFLLSMISVIEEIVFCPDELIYSQLYQSEPALYFIKRGKIIVFVKEEEGQSQIKTLKQGDSFGELAFFSNQSDELNVKAIEHTLVYKIKRAQFLEVLSKFPEDNQTFCHIQDSLLYQGNHLQAGATCLICMGEHFPKQCSFVFSIFNKMKVINSANKSEPQVRSDIKIKERKHKGFSRIKYDYFYLKLKELMHRENNFLHKYSETYLLHNRTEDEDEAEDQDQDSEDSENRKEPIEREEEIKQQQIQQRNTSILLKQSLPEQKSFLINYNGNSLKPKSTKQIETQSDILDKDTPINMPQALQLKRMNVPSSFNQSLNPIPSMAVNYLDFQINTQSNSQLQSPSEKRKIFEFNVRNSTIELEQQRNSFSENQRTPKNRMFTPVKLFTSLNQSISTIPIGSNQDIQSSEPSQFKRKSNQQLNKNQTISSHAPQKRKSRHSSLLPPINETQIENMTYNFECNESRDYQGSEQEDWNEVEDGFDIQCNFCCYLPHNNLSKIMEYFKIKQSKMKNISKKQGYQQILSLSGGQNNLNYRLLRSFQRKQNVKLSKNSNNDQCQKLTKNKQRNMNNAKTYFQLLVNKFIKISKSQSIDSEINQVSQKNPTQQLVSQCENSILSQNPTPLENRIKGQKSSENQTVSKFARMRANNQKSENSCFDLLQPDQQGSIQLIQTIMPSEQQENTKIIEESQLFNLNQDEANIQDKEDSKDFSSSRINLPRLTDSYEAGSLQIRNTLLQELDMNSMKRAIPQHEIYFD